MQLPGTLLYAGSKNKNNQHRRKFLVFQETELSDSKIKNVLYFLKRKLFLYFRKWNPAIFKSSSKNKIIIIIIIHPKEISYTIILNFFLYFRKWKP